MLAMVQRAQGYRLPKPACEPVSGLSILIGMGKKARLRPGTLIIGRKALADVPARSPQPFLTDREADVYR
jgi:hypothetical protein